MTTNQSTLGCVSSRLLVVIGWSVEFCVNGGLRSWTMTSLQQRQRFPRPCRLAFSCTAVVNMGRWIHLPTVEATVGRCNRNGFKTLMVRRCLFSSSSKEPSHCHCCRHCCLRCLVVAVAIAKATGVHYQRVTITKRNRVTRAFRLPPQQHEGIRIHLIESGRRTD